MDRLRSERVDGGPDPDGRDQVNKAVAIPMHIHAAGHGHGLLGVGRVGIGEIGGADRRGSGRGVGRGRRLGRDRNQAKKDGEQNGIKTHALFLADQAVRKMKFIPTGRRLMSLLKKAVILSLSKDLLPLPRTVISETKKLEVPRQARDDRFF
jgi:hypothetical protein